MRLLFQSHRPADFIGNVHNPDCAFVGNLGLRDKLMEQAFDKQIGCKTMRIGSMTGTCNALVANTIGHGILTLLGESIAISQPPEAWTRIDDATIITEQRF